MIPTLASIIVFSAFALFGIWYTRSKNVMEHRVRALSAQRRHMVEQEDPFSQRVMFPAVHGVTSKLVDILPTSLISRARKWLIISDSDMQLGTFLGIVLVATTLPATILLVSVLAGTGGEPGRLILLAPMAAVIGFLAPLFVLRRASKNRQLAFWKALPDSLDLLTTCVEAGLSLDFAFQRVADRQKGPVGIEISRMLREKALGQTRKEALSGMAERIDVPDVHVFVHSVIQAETLGTSIAQVLRTQARQLRMRRRQRAEQVARQAAPKMVFPLVFCVLPSLFIVVLGPIVIQAIETFNN